MKDDEEVYWMFVWSIHDLGIISDDEWLFGEWRKLAEKVGSL